MNVFFISKERITTPKASFQKQTEAQNYCQYEEQERRNKKTRSGRNFPPDD